MKFFLKVDFLAELWSEAFEWNWRSAVTGDDQRMLKEMAIKW